ncbi:hypothetical protein IHQ68_04865 [Chelatococcus sambhunathii]|uniref:Nucleotidyl transferase AbiEii toxin, Type IV TA system n=1 Tax=Chelatococcus sambhunathii TaxID=363953 RepID=A0ABU1DCW7_9HYPH|nr:hypothetical protein [Chelatococcus sambhunathii]MDR4305956.1 hypothetical protein [Chelatococcus sambhunathii]
MYDDRVAMGEAVYLDFSELDAILRVEVVETDDPVQARIRAHQLRFMFRPLRLAYLTQKYPKSPLTEDYGLSDARRSELCEAWAHLYSSGIKRTGARIIMARPEGFWRERLGALDLRCCPAAFQEVVKEWQELRRALLRLEDDLLLGRHETPSPNPQPAAA